MEKKDHSFTPLKDILSNLLGDSNLPFNPENARIWEVWDEVVGPTISKNAQPYGIKNKRLRVHVSDSIWLQELEYMADAIRDTLNLELERKAVEKIEFRVGEL